MRDRLRMIRYVPSVLFIVTAIIASTLKQCETQEIRPTPANNRNQTDSANNGGSKLKALAESKNETVIKNPVDPFKTELREFMKECGVAVPELETVTGQDGVSVKNTGNTDNNKLGRLNMGLGNNGGNSGGNAGSNNNNNNNKKKPKKGTYPTSYGSGRNKGKKNDECDEDQDNSCEDDDEEQQDSDEDMDDRRNSRGKKNNKRGKNGRMRRDLSSVVETFNRSTTDTDGNYKNRKNKRNNNKGNNYDDEDDESDEENNNKCGGGGGGGGRNNKKNKNNRNNRNNNNRNNNNKRNKNDNRGGNKRGNNNNNGNKSPYGGPYDSDNYGYGASYGGGYYGGGGGGGGNFGGYDGFLRQTGPIETMTRIKRAEDDKPACVSQCVFGYMEVLDDSRVPAETAFVQYLQNRITDRNKKLQLVRDARRCFAKLVNTDIEDGCQFSKSLSKCLNLDIEIY